ncbi:MAG TPA: type II secretion system protein GspE, partial [Candidatus Hydrogenedentes bacterium]|nr:type II secretion system protein GspE [Candidatus Hydrogenedentota bacterium]
RLNDVACDPEAVALISGRLAARHACIPVRAGSGSIALAMANPLDLIAIEDIEHATGQQVRPLIARESEIMDAITRHYGADAPAE